MTSENETNSSVQDPENNEHRREPTQTDEARAAPRVKLHRGFAAMDREAHRELARSGGVAAHAYGLAHRFTSEQAREAGKRGGAKTASNREHMAEIGRKGGFAKRGYRQDEQRGKPSEAKPSVVNPQKGLGGEALADDGQCSTDITQVVASAQIPKPSLVEIPTPSKRRPPSRGHRKGT